MNKEIDSIIKPQQTSIEDNFIINHFPSQEDIEQAEKKNKMIVCCHKIDKILTRSELNAWADGFLVGRQLSKSNNMTIYTYILDICPDEIAKMVICEITEEVKNFQFIKPTGFINQSLKGVC